MKCPGSCSFAHVFAIIEWSFGDRIRKIRRAVDASQQDFADKIGQSRDTLSAWESGRNTPRGIVAIAKRIELAYGVPASWTLGLQEAPPRPDGPEGGARWAHWGSNPEPTGAPCDLVTDNVVPLLASFTQHPEHDRKEVA